MGLLKGTTLSSVAFLLLIVAHQTLATSVSEPSLLCAVQLTIHIFL